MAAAAPGGAPTDSSRGLGTGVLVLLVLGALAILPAACWHLAPKREFAVLVIDKTVPPRSGYREHAGLFWVLNHFRYTLDGARYDVATDYAGYHPGLEDGDAARVTGVDTTRTWDLIYAADAYGVYAADLADSAGSDESGALVHGGLDADEIALMRAHVAAGRPLIAEFATFASPTRPAEREALLEMLGIEWTGWIARRFDDLSADAGIPSWAPRAWQARTGQPWPHDGPGVLFVHEDGEMVVLREGPDLDPEPVVVVFGDEAVHAWGTARSLAYPYWVDIVRPRAGTVVLAEYMLRTHPGATARLQRAGIPARFPAVLRRSEGHTAYYFAGDWADAGDPARFERMLWSELVYRYLLDYEEGDPRAFYWSAYVPMMRALLAELAGDAGR